MGAPHSDDELADYATKHLCVEPTVGDDAQEAASSAR